MWWTHDAKHRASDAMCDALGIARASSISITKASSMLHETLRREGRLVETAGAFAIGDRLADLGIAGPTVRFCDLQAGIQRHFRPFELSSQLIARMRRAVARGEKARWCLRWRDLVFVFDGCGNSGYELEIVADAISGHECLSTLRQVADAIGIWVHVDCYGEDPSQNVHRMLCEEGFECCQDGCEIDFWYPRMFN